MSKPVEALELLRESSHLVNRVEAGVDACVLHVVTLDEFADTDEAGADALVGADSDSALMPEGGDVMFYGDGGAGKTTLVIDLTLHLAAGDPWLGIPISQPVTVLVIENEGPRPLFRKKLRRKRESWGGSPVGDRIRVLEEPWARLTLSDERHRLALADTIRRFAIDVVVIGPVTAAGMFEAGTIQQVRDFMTLVKDVREQAGRIVAFVLVHHENKGGAVSGAWEGVGDTLLHVQGQGHGHTRILIQKARWSSSHHGTSRQLAWTDGEGFQVSDDPVRDDETTADEILDAVLLNGGTSWNAIDAATTGKGERKRAIRDRLLSGGRLIDAGGAGGMKLWHADDPARPPIQDELRPDGDAPGDALVSGPGETAGTSTASLRPRSKGTQDAGTHPVPPFNLTDAELREPELPAGQLPSTGSSDGGGCR